MVSRGPHGKIQIRSTYIQAILNNINPSLFNILLRTTHCLLIAFQHPPQVIYVPSPPVRPHPSPEAPNTITPHSEDSRRYARTLKILSKILLGVSWNCTVAVNSLNFLSSLQILTGPVALWSVTFHLKGSATTTTRGLIFPSCNTTSVSISPSEVIRDGVAMSVFTKYFFIFFSSLRTFNAFFLVTLKLI